MVNTMKLINRKVNYMIRYFEDKVIHIGRLRIKTIRTIWTFPVSWLDKLFEAIKIEGEHKLTLSDTGATLILETTNGVGIAMALEDMF